MTPIKDNRVLEQFAKVIVGFLGLGRLALVGLHLHARTVGQFIQGFLEIQPILLHHELEDVAALVARAEAAPGAGVGVGVGVEIPVGTGVLVGVGTRVAVGIGVMVGVTPGGRVGMRVGVGVIVGVTPGGREGMRVGVGVIVGVTPGGRTLTLFRSLPEQRIQPVQFSAGDNIPIELQKGLPEHFVGGGSVGKSQ